MPSWRVRTSTVLLTVIFVATLVTYILVRPGPSDPTTPNQRSGTSTNTRQSSRAPSAGPTSAVPTSAAPSPDATATPTPTPTPDGTASPTGPSTAGTPEPTLTPSP